MNSEKLYLSFWEICLKNLPVGEFKHRLIVPEDARSLINQARAKKTLLCVSTNDLLGDQQTDKRDDHNKLFHVLREYFGISIVLKDFLLEDKDDDGNILFSTIPLDVVQVQGNQPLIVVTCSYIWEPEDLEELNFTVDPESVEFHLFEALLQP